MLRVELGVNSQMLPLLPDETTAFIQHLTLKIQHSLAAVIFHEVARGFVELDAVQPGGRDGGQLTLDDLPEGDGQVFGAGHLAGQEGHIEVEVFVVDLLGDVGA